MTRRGDDRLALVARGDLVRERDARELETRVQGLWFSLVRAQWNSLVVVPADEGESAAGVVTALADVGRRLRNVPVTFLVMAGSVDYASASRFVTRVAGGGAGGGGEPADGPPTSRVIVAVPPVVIEPLALAVTSAADAVAILVRRGRSRLSATARTLELVGRERVIGSILG